MSLEICYQTLQNRFQRERDKQENARQEALQVILAKAPAIIAAFSSIQRAYLFGSVTRYGAFHAKSDIDLAIEGATAEDYFALFNALEKTFPSFTIDLRELMPGAFFTKQVHTRGFILYERAN